MDCVLIFFWEDWRIVLFLEEYGKIDVRHTITTWIGIV